VAKRALLIYNPAARRAPGAERLRQAGAAVPGWEVSLEPTGAAGHATELAQEAAAAGLDAVVACGGDGTVNEVANGLAGSPTGLAVVRGGTANVWAKEVRVPKDPRKALRLLADGETRAIDLGRADGRYYILMAGIGFDAHVVRGIGGGAKRRFGAAAYVTSGLRAALTYKAVEAELTIDAAQRRSHLYWLLVGNTRNYGGAIDITRWAQADDGELDVLLMRKGGFLRFIWFWLLVALRRQRSSANIAYEKAHSVDVSTPGLPVQIDGEDHGDTPMRFEVAPGALRVIVPRGLRSPLFRG
jgi:YegS/Rv2252/BmrU family lipid kinase